MENHQNHEQLDVAHTFQKLLETYLQHNPCLDSGDRYATQRAFNLMFEIFPDADTESFSALKLLEFQQFLAKKNYTRNYCNKLVKSFRSVMNWGAKFDIVSENIACKLNRVKLLRFGQAKESKKRKNIPIENIEAIIPYIRPMIADMLRLQSLTAMRPSEVCRMKAEEIDMNYDGENWLYSPPKHKTAWRGKSRCIVLGWEEQEILKKYITTQNSNIFLNNIGKPFSVRRYGKIIKEVIEKNKLPKFTSYQLRHNAITEISLTHDKDKAIGQLPVTVANSQREFTIMLISKKRKSLSTAEKRKLRKTQYLFYEFIRRTKMKIGVQDSIKKGVQDSIKKGVPDS
jgi:integrase